MNEERGAAEREYGTVAAQSTRGARLTNEQTQLAWWRTGLTSLAVAVGVGRILPEVDDSAVDWHYYLLGIGFALYGVGMIWFGTVSAMRVDRELREGVAVPTPLGAWRMFALAGAALGTITAVLIITG